MCGSPPTTRPEASSRSASQRLQDMPTGQGRRVRSRPAGCRRPLALMTNIRRDPIRRDPNDALRTQPWRSVRAAGQDRDRDCRPGRGAAARRSRRRTTARRGNGIDQGAVLDPRRTGSGFSAAHADARRDREDRPQPDHERAAPHPCYRAARGKHGRTVIANPLGRKRPQRQATTRNRRTSLRRIRRPSKGRTRRTKCAVIPSKHFRKMPTRQGDLNAEQGMMRHARDLAWQGQQGSNPRPADLESAALPTELYPFRSASNMAGHGRSQGESAILVPASRIDRDGMIPTVIRAGTIRR